MILLLNTLYKIYREKKFVLLFIFILSVDFINAQPPAKKKYNEKKKLIFADSFEKKLDTLFWKIEMESIDTPSVSIANRKLELNTRGGVTVWLRRPLSGSVEIEYKRKIIIANGKNDRLSDMNQFWMAQDPANSNLFTRAGKFEEYDNLQLYYVGVGGNTNTTTRFRKYTGTSERNLIQEYTDKPHLLIPNHEYLIKIIVNNNTIQFYVDNNLYFTYEDAAVLKQGYFGFRSTYSHQAIDDLKIYQIN